MTADNTNELREWRRTRGWDVPELARRLRRAADEPVAAHDGLVRRRSSAAIMPRRMTAISSGCAG